MEQAILSRELLLWSAALVVGVPLLVILLGEMRERLRRGGNRLAAVLDNFQKLVLFPLVFLILVRQILGFDRLPAFVRMIETVVWLTLAYTLLGLLSVLVQGLSEGGWRLRVPALSYQLGRALIVLGTIIYITAAVWHLPLDQMATAFGVGSLVIALALQDTLSSLVSGLLLLFERPLETGDWIRVGEVEGQVVEANWRAVRLYTLSRDIVIIPNAVLGGEVIHNYTLSDPLHAESYEIGFSFDNPPNRVKRMLEEAALGTDGIVSDPRPQAWASSFGEYLIHYEIRIFVEGYDQTRRIMSDLTTNIYYMARRDGLNIPYPIQHELEIEPPADLGDDAEQSIRKQLRTLQNMGALDRQTIHALAQEAVLIKYGAGERVVRRGAFDRGLFIICEGRVALTVTDRGEERLVNELTAGEVFGERVLLPDEPSLVTVTVLDDLEAVFLTSKTVHDLVEENPAFALEMHDFIEGRKRAVTVHSSRGKPPKRPAAAGEGRSDA